MPLASAAGVTAGLLSNSDFVNFNSKQSALSAGSGISIAGSVISATGLTTSNLATSAGITNGQLQNNAIIFGSTSQALGSTVSTLSGLSTVNATNFVGALTGNASTATSLQTGRTIGTTGDVTYTSPSFNGTGNVTGNAVVNSVGGVVSSTIATMSTTVSAATSNNTVNTLVRRDASGNISAGTITANNLNLTNPLTTANGGTGTNLTLANNVFAGPLSSTVSSAPSFRRLTLEDLPDALNGITGNVNGDILYWKDGNWVLLPVPVNANGQVLTIIEGVPTWQGNTGGTSLGGNIVSETGRVWMDRNLGASRAATSSTDHFGYGSLFQWGRAADGHEVIFWTNSTSGTVRNAPITTQTANDFPTHSNFIALLNQNNWRTTNNDLLWQGIYGINNPCPSGFRLPTQAEFQAEIDTWTANYGASTASVAASSSLKLPVPGQRSNGTAAGLGVNGIQGYYWTSTVGASNFAMRLNIQSGTSAAIGSSPKSFGFSVRCIKD
jgi:uncharacterized protein (TIGR02145 family)